MKRFSAVGVVFACLLFAACSTTATPSDTNASSSASMVPSSGDTTTSMEEDQATENVTYVGTVTTLSVTNTREGTHLLEIPGGATILLRSGTLSLDQYVGKSVRAMGSVRPTADGSAKILDVFSVEIVLTAGETGESSSVGEMSAAPVAAASSAAPAPPKESSAAPSPPPASPPPTLSAETQIMAKERLDAARWTLQYCSSFIGFCIPVHKNWYFHQFPIDGYVWHVEIAAHELAQSGDGPLVVNLVADASAGTMESKGAQDGTVREEGEFAIGYRAWTGGRHFEISAPRVLLEAVRFITQGLTAYGNP